MVNLNGIQLKPTADGKVTFTRSCPFCGKQHSITVKQDDFAAGARALCHGALVQDAFPSFSADEREMLITGICSKCWSKHVTA